MVELNVTVLIQLANFIIALVGMNYLLIAPVRKIIKERRDLASGLLRDTEQFASDAADRLENYESALAKAREEASASREADKAAALARESGILENAQREAQEFLRESRENTQAMVNQAMAEMRGKIPALADQSAARLLGKKTTKKSGR